jgi:RNA polymerase sigma factor (sigma-70 family)
MRGAEQTKFNKADNPPNSQAPALNQGHRNELVKNYEPLVHGIVRRKFGGFPHLVDDLLQAGRLGLVKAADKFDPEVCPFFGPYAEWWIRAEIKACLRSSVGAVKRPKDVPFRADVSLNEPAQCQHDGDEEIELIDLLADEPADTTVAELRDKLDEIASDVLKPREAQIIHDRHLVDEPKTLAQIGAELGGISVERVRQIEARSIQKLKARTSGRVAPPQGGPAFF